MYYLSATLCMTIMSTVPYAASSEYLKVRRKLQGASNWLQSKLPEHSVTSKINFELNYAVLQITVELMGERFDHVKDLERIACGAAR